MKNLIAQKIADGQQINSRLTIEEIMSNIIIKGK